MKKILFVTIPLLALPMFAFAFGTSLIPFGGRVVAVHVPPNVACWTDLVSSPFSIMPVTASPAAPWSKMYGLVNVGLITPGAWILGKYRPTVEGCVQVNGPEANPFPTLQTDFYGTSIPKPVPVPFL